MVTPPVLITQQRGSFGLQMTKMKRTVTRTLWICLLWAFPFPPLVLSFCLVPLHRFFVLTGKRWDEFLSFCSGCDRALLGAAANFCWDWSVSLTPFSLDSAFALLQAAKVSYKDVKVWVKTQVVNMRTFSTYGWLVKSESTDALEQVCSCCSTCLKGDHVVVRTDAT